MTDLPGSTSTWNPERVFPSLGDSEPCPSVEEQAYEVLREALFLVTTKLRVYAGPSHPAVQASEAALAEARSLLGGEA